MRQSSCQVQRQPDCVGDAGLAGSLVRLRLQGNVSFRSNAALGGKQNKNKTTEDALEIGVVMNRLAGTYLGWTYFPAGCTKGGEGSTTSNKRGLARRIDAGRRCRPTTHKTRFPSRALENTFAVRLSGYLSASYYYHRPPLLLTAHLCDCRWTLCNTQTSSQSCYVK